MRRTVTVLAVTALLLGAGAIPAQAATTKFSSCALLLKKYPKGVAKSVETANAAAQAGFAKPKVDAALYKVNGARLDRDKDGVMCEQQGQAPAPAASPSPSPSPSATSAGAPGVNYLPTGAVLLDFWMKSQKYSQDQANLAWSFSRTIQSPSFTATVCTGWRIDPATMTETLISASANQFKGDATEAWLRSQINMIVTTTCVAKGYSFN